MNFVKSSSLARLPMPVFQQVIKNILMQLQGLGLQDPPLTTALSALQTAYTDLDGSLKRVQGSIHTQELLALDTRRDNLVRGLGLLLRAYTYAASPSKAEAARVLLHYFDGYGSDIMGQAQLTQTATIYNLLQDFQKPDASTAGLQVSLADWTLPLQDVNDQFENLYSVRAADLDVPEAGLTKRYRAVTQERLDAFVTRLNALQTLSITPNAAWEQAAAIISTEVKTAKTNVKKGGNNL